MKRTAYIALGSNLGERSANLAAARTAIATLRGTRILAESSVEETAPMGPVEQPLFLNQMLAVETSLAPGELLAGLLRIERQCGRERGVRWGPRTLDLDIVLFEAETVVTPELTIPHPEIENRNFWKREIEELNLALGA